MKSHKGLVVNEKGGSTPRRHAIKVQMSMHLDKAPFSGVKLLLITKSVPLKGNSITFSKQGCFHTDIPTRQHTPPPLTHPRPFSLGAPSLLGSLMVE